MTAKVLASGSIQNLTNLVVFGDARVLDLGIRDAGIALPCVPYACIDEIRFPHERLRRRAWTGFEHSFPASLRLNARR